MGRRVETCLFLVSKGRLDDLLAHFSVDAEPLLQEGKSPASRERCTRENEAGYPFMEALSQDRSHVDRTRSDRSPPAASAYPTHLPRRLQGSECVAQLVCPPRDLKGALPKRPGVATPGRKLREGVVECKKLGLSKIAFV